MGNDERTVFGQLRIAPRVITVIVRVDYKIDWPVRNRLDSTD